MSDLVGPTGPDVRLETADRPHRVLGSGPRGILRIDEALGDSPATEFRPVLKLRDSDGVTSQTFSEIASYDVPPSKAALLDEVSASVDGDGDILLEGSHFDSDPISGAKDVAVPFNGAVLIGGQSVRVLHRSTSGTASDAEAMIVAREV